MFPISMISSEVSHFSIKGSNFFECLPYRTWTKCFIVKKNTRLVELVDTADSKSALTGIGSSPIASTYNKLSKSS